MRRALLDELLCPLSGTPLVLRVHEAENDDVLTGTLTSDAATYPIVAGIPVLRPGASEVVELVAAGDHLAATAAAAFDGLPRGRALRLAAEMSALPGAGALLRGLVAALERQRRRADVAAVREGLVSPLAPVRRAYVATPARSVDAFNYFTYRCAMPRHLVGLSSIDALLPAPAPGPVLDLGCGAGHLTWSILGRAGANPVIGVDRELFLLLAARLLAPGADLVCADLTALPFPAEWASVAFAFDVLSFVTPKATVVREIERVLTRGGRMALTSVKNALAQHVFAGEPLSPAGWRSLVAHLEHRVLADDDILGHYLDGIGLPAKAEPSSEVLDRARVLTVLAAKGASGFDDESMFDEWPHARGPLAVNPLYRAVSSTSTGVRYERVLPAGAYAADNPELCTYLPSHFEASEDVVMRAARGEHPEELEPLVRRLAVLSLPPRLVEERWPTPSREGSSDAA